MNHSFQIIFSPFFGVALINTLGYGQARNKALKEQTIYILKTLPDFKKIRVMLLRHPYFQGN
ncbi:hypothetical protein KJ966_20685 [bacterium]|nr:hypothetical protein [bacterium]